MIVTGLRGPGARSPRALGKSDVLARLNERTGLAMGGPEDEHGQLVR